MQPVATNVCKQQNCHDCGALALALVCSIVMQRSVQAITLATPCTGLRAVTQVVDAYTQFGACDGNHCRVIHVPPPLPMPCPAAPSLRVVRRAPSARWLATRVKGRRGAVAATFAVDFPVCSTLLPTTHMVAVIGAHAGFLLVQNSWGRSWGANGLAAVRMHRARACRLLDAVVVPYLSAQRIASGHGRTAASKQTDAARHDGVYANHDNH